MDVTGDETRHRRLAWVLATFVVASLLAFDPGGWAVFGPVKWTIVLTASAAALAVLPRSVEMYRGTAIGWAVFLLWGVVVSIVAVDPVHTWIGTPDRHLGLLAWAVFVVLFVAGQQIDAGGVRVVLRAATIALLGIGAYAVLEWLGAPPVELNLETARFGGPFGSAAYLGAACVLLIPVAIGSALDDGEIRPWRVLAGGAAMLGAVAIIGSQTRAAWVGLAVAGVVALPAIWSRADKRRWVALAAAILGVVVLLASPAGDRARAVFDADDPATRGRVDEWRIAAALVAERPITGAGFEGHRIVFPEKVTVEYEQKYGRAVTPDRAHNGALDVAVTSGIPGMVLYLTIMAFLLRSGWVAVRSGKPWLVGLGAGVVGYAVQQQFLFPLAEVDPTFWVLSGVLVAAAPDGRLIRVSIPRVARVVAGVLAVGFLVVGSLDVAADRSARTALDAATSEEAQNAGSRATNLRPESIRYWVVFAAVAAEQGGIEEIKIAIERIDHGLRISAEDPILRARKAEYQLALARLSGSGEDIATAVASWAALVEYDANNARYQLQYGVAAALARDAMTAESAWLRCELLAPNSVAALANLAVLYLAGGHSEAARAVLARGLAIQPDSPELLDIQQRIEAADGS